MRKLTPRLIFPTRILYVDEDDFSYQQDLIEYCYRYSKNHPPNIRSNIDGYQTDGSILVDEEFKSKFYHRILDYINESTSAYIQDTKMEEDIKTKPLRVVSLWMNINPPGAYNVEHVHPGSVISGVMWIKVPEDSGKFYINNPNMYNDHRFGQAGVTMNPKEGSMLVFPSWLPHSVGKNNSNEDRISISFNVAQQVF